MAFVQGAGRVLAKVKDNKTTVRRDWPKVWPTRSRGHSPSPRRPRHAGRGQGPSLSERARPLQKALSAALQGAVLPRICKSRARPLARGLVRRSGDLRAAMNRMNQARPMADKRRRGQDQWHRACRRKNCPIKRGRSARAADLALAAPHEPRRHAPSIWPSGSSSRAVEVADGEPRQARKPVTEPDEEHPEIPPRQEASRPIRPGHPQGRQHRDPERARAPAGRMPRRITSLPV